MQGPSVFGRNPTITYIRGVDLVGPVMTPSTHSAVVEFLSAPHRISPKTRIRGEVVMKRFVEGETGFRARCLPYARPGAAALRPHAAANRTTPATFSHQIIGKRKHTAAARNTALRHGPTVPAR